MCSQNAAKIYFHIAVSDMLWLSAIYYRWLSFSVSHRSYFRCPCTFDQLPLQNFSQWCLWGPSLIAAYAMVLIFFVQGFIRHVCAYFASDSNSGDSHARGLSSIFILTLFSFSMSIFRDFWIARTCSNLWSPRWVQDSSSRKLPAQHRFLRLYQRLRTVQWTNTTYTLRPRCSSVWPQ
jgi:hypothetical protein